MRHEAGSTKTVCGVWCALCGVWCVVGVGWWVVGGGCWVVGVGWWVLCVGRCVWCVVYQLKVADLTVDLPTYELPRCTHA